MLFGYRQFSVNLRYFSDQLSFWILQCCGSGSGWAPSGSVIILYGSGSCINKPKNLEKPWFLLFSDFSMPSMFPLKTVVNVEPTKKKNCTKTHFLLPLWKSLKKNSCRIRIRNSVQLLYENWCKCTFKK